MFRQANKAVLMALVVLGSCAPGCGKSPEPSTPDARTQEAGTDSKLAAPAKGLTIDLGKGVKLEMVLVPAGEFLMGSPDADKDARDEEKPQHRVRITRPFYLGKYPVTQEQWEVVMAANPSNFKGAKNPVESVGWDDCRQFIDKLNKIIDKLNKKPHPGGGKFQLPSEAQWEYACRAGTASRYGFGDDEDSVGDYAWYLANSGDRPNPVGQKKPNAFGLFDMHGNVGEWCEDWYGERYYAESTRDDPTGPARGSTRVNRGGGWDRPARYCRSAFRSYYVPGFRLNFVGLRLALSASDK